MRIHFKQVVFFIVLHSLSLFALAEGNESISSFQIAKKKLLLEVYHTKPRTLYCNAEFGRDKRIVLPDGFKSEKHRERSNRVEFEHVVPAENFGRSFDVWRDGHPNCVDSKGKSYKGRRCAEKQSAEFRFMQSDLYNLFPAIGSVNASRKNYNFTQFEDQVPSAFGSCSFKIKGRKAEPPDASKGRVARSYLYMDRTYSRFNMSRSMKNLMRVWDCKYPVSTSECANYRAIKSIQQNDNPILRERCNINNRSQIADKCKEYL